MNITLIGMAGAGKSYIGEKLACKLKYKFIDIDKLIEKKLKTKIKNIINDSGEARFLKTEEKVILGLKRLNNSIISPGGSVIYSKKAMKFLKKNSTVVFLNTPFKIIEKRIPNPSERGIIKYRQSNFKTLYKKRLLLYKRYSDFTIKIQERSNANKTVSLVRKKVHI